jgi:hypothetical protein
MSTLSMAVRLIECLTRMEVGCLDRGEYQMQKLRLIILASGLALLLPVTGYTQSVSDIQDLSPEERRAYMESMSPDERAAMREKWRAELDAMPEEERRAMRERMAADRPEGQRNRAAMRERWESMSEEERAAARLKREQIRAQRREHWESMSEEERTAAREKRGKHAKGRHGGAGKHNGENPDNTK